MTTYWDKHTAFHTAAVFDYFLISKSKSYCQTALAHLKTITYTQHFRVKNFAGCSRAFAGAAAPNGHQSAVWDGALHLEHSHGFVELQRPPHTPRAAQRRGPAHIFLPYLSFHNSVCGACTECMARIFRGLFDISNDNYIQARSYWKTGQLTRGLSRLFKHRLWVYSSVPINLLTSTT